MERHLPVGGMPQIAKTLILVGLALSALGGVMFALSKLGLGELPGDFTWQGKNTRIVFPLASSLLLSLILTVVLNLWLRRHR
jgi:hypothetical protein